MANTCRINLFPRSCWCPINRTHQCITGRAIGKTGGCLQLQCFQGKIESKGVPRLARLTGAVSPRYLRSCAHHRHTCLTRIVPCRAQVKMVVVGLSKRWLLTVFNEDFPLSWNELDCNFGFINYLANTAYCSVCIPNIYHASHPTKNILKNLGCGGKIGVNVLYFLVSNPFPLAMSSDPAQLGVPSP